MRMLTGDSAATALAVARDAGIIPAAVAEHAADSVGNGAGGPDAAGMLLTGPQFRRCEPVARPYL